MKKLWIGLLLSFPLFSQTTVIQRPDCILPLGLLTTASTNVGPFDNRTTGCNTWAIDYTSFGFTVLSLVVQTAPNATGNVPGSWSTFTAVTGINPNTATTQAATTFGGTTSYFPWLRVQLTSVTGTGSVTGVLYGWKIPAAPPGGTGCIGTVATPCVVVGPGADGAAVVGSPVRIAGKDGSGNTQDMRTDTNGNTQAVGPTASGAAPTTAPVLVAGQDDATGNVQTLQLSTNGYIVAGNNVALADNVSNSVFLPVYSGSNGGQNQVFGMLFDGANWDRTPGNSAGGAFVQGPAAEGAAAAGNPVRQGVWDGANISTPFICTNQASFNLTGSGNTQIIAASGATTIRICHLSFSTTAAEDIKVTRGTGSDCGTGTNDVTGLYKSVQGLALDFQPSAALRGAASGAICLNQSAVQNLGGIVIFAQF